ncbi:hypothetical protein [Hymenobacter aerophilus]|uniref:hypothetical protein n=1 Tax=Hymenobacter aerophilus TaxID=119644 RepID=UPI00039B107C|nr:hypothetical protein [Hymenobacter aerophilus]
MPRSLAHLLLLLYAGLFLHCQPLPARGAGSGWGGNAPQQQSRAGLCKKKLQTVQSAPVSEQTQLAKTKLLLPDLALGSDFAALYFGLLLPADAPHAAPVRGPNAGLEQAFANHPNKAPPVRFS